MRVYLKLRNGAWILVTKKIEQTTVSGKKRLTRHILAGMAVSGPPGSLNDGDSIKVPANTVNRVISRLLDVDDDVAVIVEPLNVNYYIIKVSPGKGEIVESLLSRSPARGKTL